MTPQRTCRLIGQGRVIKEWVLLTPAYESKRIIEYAHTRSAEVLSKPQAASWLGDYFRISVHDDSLFAAARNTLTGVRRHQLSVESAATDLDGLRNQDLIPAGIEKILTDKFLVDPQLAASKRKLARYLDENLTSIFHEAGFLMVQG